MTLSEFKAWFEGFTEGMDKAPTQKQWARVKERVGEISGTPITYPVYIDRYWPNRYPFYSAYSAVGQSAGLTGQTYSTNSASALGAPVDPAFTKYETLAKEGFDSHAAMHALGTADRLASTS